MEAIKRDWRSAELDDADRTMLAYVEKLTRTPAEMVREDVERLREAGFDDEAISEIAMIAGLFGFYNRIADGLGIDPEERW